MPRPRITQETVHEAFLDLKREARAYARAGQLNPPNLETNNEVSLARAARRYAHLVSKVTRGGRA